MKESKVIYFSLITIIISLVIISCWHTFYTDYGYNYDDSKISLLLEIVEKSGQLTYLNELNPKYDTFGFVPQGGEITLSRVIFSKGFIGEKISLIPIFLVFGDIGLTFKFTQIFFITGFFLFNS